MCSASVNVVHPFAMLVWLTCMADVAFCVYQSEVTAPLARAKASTKVEDDGIQDAIDQLAAMSNRLPNLPDLPENLEYLVRETADGHEVTVVPAGLAEQEEAAETDAEMESDENAPVFLDHDESAVRSEEAKIASITAHKVVELNRFNFHNSVLRDGHDQPVHWIVRFCHDWYAPCEHLTGVFDEIAIRFEKMLNANDQFQTTVRFADVDCSTNKPLCNEVADYHFPQIIHFHEQARFSDWKAGNKSPKHNMQSLMTWMEKQAKVIENEKVNFPSKLEAKIRNRIVRKESGIEPIRWDVRHLIAVFLAMAGALAGYFWLLVRRITGIDCHGVRAKPPCTLAQRQDLTCKDMLPADWRPEEPNGRPILEL